MDFVEIAIYMKPRKWDRRIESSEIPRIILILIEIPKWTNERLENSRYSFCTSCSRFIIDFENFSGILHHLFVMIDNLI